MEADWRQLERELGTVHNLTEASDTLKITASVHTDDATVVVFCNPLLLKETLGRLDNQKYIKLCGDGTFRLTRDEWVLMTVGVLSKHYARADGFHAFRTSFDPLLFALANKESQPTYQVLFDALESCALQFAGMSLRETCAQYHADMHYGEDLEVKAAFAKALRVTDWAHFLGACSRPKKSFDAPCERIAAYRAGVIATMKKHLSTFGQKLVPLIERAIFCLRSLPTALLFILHTVTHVLLQTLLAQQPSERPAAKAFRKHYLSLLSEEEAKSAYGLANWPGGPDLFYTADWWCGIQRIQPGSASGTQAQESWHGQKLKKYMGLRQSLPVLVQSLSSFASSRLQNL